MIGHTIFLVVVKLDDVKPEDLNDAIARLMENIPLGAILSVLIAWCAGALLGAAMAVVVAARAPRVHRLIVGGLILAASIFTLIKIPHPIWFTVAALLLIPVCTWWGASLGTRLRPTNKPAAA
jgi:hypothetical protein